MFDIGAQSEADRAQDPVHAAAGPFRDDVAGVVHDIGVATAAALEDVGALAAVQIVIADATEQRVVALAAFEAVVAAEAVQEIVPITADQPVVAAEKQRREKRF